jgi:phosphatidylglycerol:prolipoprotein diacylglycerol transferase
MHPQLFQFAGVTLLYAIAVIAAITVLWVVLAARRRPAADVITGVAIAAVICAILLWLWLTHRPLPIWSYGVMLMLAFAAGIVWAVHEARLRELDSDIVLDLAFFVLLGSIIGARLLHVALEYSHYRGQPIAIFTEWGYGLSFHGGLLGGVTAGLLFAHFRKISFWMLGDLAAPSTALGYAVARIGCFLRGCCYGAPTHLPWACRFPDPIAPDLAHIRPQDLTVPSHPTQLYSAAASLVIFALLLRLRGRMPARGQLFLAYVAIYSVVRWLMEILRRGYTAHLAWPGAWLTQAQIASMVLFLLSIVGIWVLGRREARAALHEQQQQRTHSKSRRSRRRA